MSTLKSYTSFVLGCIILQFITSCAYKNDSNSTWVNKTEGKGGSLSRFVVKSNYLYSVDNEFLSVFDLTKEEEPQFVKKIRVGNEIETIFPFKDRLFIGSTSVIYIYDISTPDTPKKVSTAASQVVQYRCDPVVAKDNVAYATLRVGNSCSNNNVSVLAVYDISDETQPVEKLSIPLTEPYGLGYAGDVLYVCENNGLKIFNISQMYKPELIKTIVGVKHLDVIPYDNILICWVESGIILYSINDRENPEVITLIK